MPRTADAASRATNGMDATTAIARMMAKMMIMGTIFAFFVGFSQCPTTAAAPR